MNLTQSKERDYAIKYVDKDSEMINVSDDEDLLTAYEVAEFEMQGNLKFIIEMKQGPSPSEELKKDKKIVKKDDKIKKKDKKEKDKKEKKALKKKAKSIK